MSGELILRIDDRLVHGQVTAGWVQPLGIGRIVLANDAVAADRFESDLYAAAVPAGVELAVVPVGEALAALGRAGAGRTMCLVSGTADARRLLEQGLDVKTVNIGGIHAGPGRRPVLPFVSLNAAEEADCRALTRRGVRLEARMLPGSEAYDLAEFLGPAAQVAEGQRA